MDTLPFMTPRLLSLLWLGIFNHLFSPPAIWTSPSLTTKLLEKMSYLCLPTIQMLRYDWLTTYWRIANKTKININYLKIQIYLILYQTDNMWRTKKEVILNLFSVFFPSCWIPSYRLSACLDLLLLEPYNWRHLCQTATHRGFLFWQLPIPGKNDHSRTVKKI